MSEDKKPRPVILLLNGYTQKAEIVREMPKTVIERKKSTKKAKLKSITVEFAANGGYAVTMRYLGSKDTTLLLCKNKEDLFETLEFVTPVQPFGDQG